MQYRIPPQDDLLVAQEGDLTCYRVLWPNTQAWRGILAGLLYLVTRGRTWAADSGSIVEAQAAGYRLFRVNVPLVSCDDQPGGPDAPGIDDLEEMCRAVAGGDGGWEDDIMWAITDITIEHGRLVLHYGPCCRKVVDGELLASTDIESRNPYDTAIDPSTGKPYTGYACGKAAALVNAVWAALDNLVNSAHNPMGVIHAITSGQPEISWDRLDLWRAYLSYANAYLQDEVDPLDLLGFEGGSVIWEVDGILDPRRKQTWICRLSARLSNDTTCTDRDIDQLRTVMAQIYSIGMSNAINALIDAIGRGDLKAIGAAGAIVQADCSCPDLHPTTDPILSDIPTGVTWAYVIDYRLSDYGFVSHDGTHWTAGVGWSEDTVIGNDMRAVKLSVRNTATGPDNTKIHYARVHSSSLPTGTITELRYFDIYYFEGPDGSHVYNNGALPAQPVYRAEWPGGAGWLQGHDFVLMGGFFRGAGGPPTGRHTVDHLIIAGTGTPPIPALTNILA